MNSYYKLFEFEEDDSLTNYFNFKMEYPAEQEGAPKLKLTFLKPLLIKDMKIEAELNYFEVKYQAVQN